MISSSVYLSNKEKRVLDVNAKGKISRHNVAVTVNGFLKIFFKHFVAISCSYNPS